MREQRANLPTVVSHLFGDRVAEALCGLLLGVALIFGGGSRGAGDLIVHVVALLALAAGLMRWQGARATGTQSLFVFWLIAAVLLLVMQLVPLPASLFGALPQRGEVLADLRQAGPLSSWLPMTLDVWGTVRALLALATLGAGWLLASTLDAEARSRLLRLALIIGSVMALLGFAQAAAGEHSRLRPYVHHHSIGALGSFANRNHFADLMAMLIPAAVSFAHAAQTRLRSASSVFWYAVASLLFLASALSYSRMGIVLAAAATAVAILLAVRIDERPSKRRLAPMLAIAFATLGVAVYAWGGIAQRLTQDPLADLRWQYFRYGTEAARAYLPWGSGAGSFRDVYAPFEPIAAMRPTYALHAHNDLLEVALEAGVPGLLLVLFLVVLLFRAVREALRRNGGRRTSITIPAAAGAVFVPLVHSFVDYPLRTLSVATVFAILIAILMAPPVQRVG